MRELIGLARSLEGRTVTVLLLAVLVVHSGALALYRRSAVVAAEEAFASEVAKQLVLAREAILRRPAEARRIEAKALSSAHFEIGWEQAEATGTGQTDFTLRSLRDRVLALEPVLGPTLSLALEMPDEPLHQQDLRGALALADGSVLTFRSAHSPSSLQLGAGWSCRQSWLSSLALLPSS